MLQGYSSLAVALVLPDSGCLVACDRSEASLAVAQKYFKLGGVSHKVLSYHKILDQDPTLSLSQPTFAGSTAVLRTFVVHSLYAEVPAMVET